MRLAPLLALLWIAACGDSVDLESGLDACGIAHQMNSEAIAEATHEAGPCETDADCVRISDAIQCPSVQLRSCGLTVHRRAAEAYAASGVEARICEATSDATYGCYVTPACAEIGDPVCVDGVCRGDAL